MKKTGIKYFEKFGYKEEVRKTVIARRGCRVERKLLKIGTSMLMVRKN